MWTVEFERFVAPARFRPQIWRLFLGIVLTVAIYAVGIMALLLAVWSLAGTAGLMGWMQNIAAADTPTSVLLMLATFGGMFAGPLVVARLLHRRPAASVLGNGVLRGFVMAAAITVAVFAAALLLMPPGFPLVPNTPLPMFLSFLPLALLGLLVQTGAEEVLFRGYLQGQLAARFRSPLVWMLVPALIFGSLHYDPVTAGSNAIWLVAVATLFGLLAADLTRVTGNIGAAWGLHFVNNATAILIVALDGSLSGLALYVTPFDAADVGTLRPLIVQDALTTVIVWACIRLWLARRATRAAA
ncbi:CPBP family intramembrane glutamic endopeptidase [Jannaschia rubra]|uniref:CAAX amino terminal protease self-immunity n=1 Tax=Jannaschia rubra TaxID=282197 RepID=A0A0M6XPS9_9RHOB|nr:type II CAAX endopeptidase family protein [Jannaschia rubra]CTQ32607.1 CAAX amino terminal protease self-immunity [Jannaschia rubra]SFF85926.1 hypothetical protein SAMN04488517_101541 [Jannaschia rubra]